MSLGPLDRQLLEVAQGKQIEFDDDITEQLTAQFQALSFQEQGEDLRQAQFRLCVSTLLEKGANIDCEEPETLETPLIKAAFSGLFQVVNLLLEKGAKLGLNKERTQTALHAACSMGHFPIAQLLIKTNQALVHHQDKRKAIALHYAVNHPQLVAFLIDSGSDVDAQCMFSNTVLHHAAKVGAPLQTLIILLAHGANYTLENSDGQSAFDAVKQLNAYPELIALLEDKERALTLKAKEMSVQAKVLFLLGSCYVQESSSSPVTMLPFEMCHQICSLVGYHNFRKEAYEALKQASANNQLAQSVHHFSSAKK